ncbi:hypothetical protein [Herbaspirillum sp. GW103]|uniref:hypothetical protein n=1 Tax=Herbaspirillum sp. GW103 TaxID=1175306 RepID=UPI000559110F|nr:hypothetical protein [Herbaspirillum sp. GW103]
MSDLKNGVRYEVALEVLGQGRQPFMQAIHDEQQKAKPSQDFIRYCEMRLAALDELQDSLTPTDTETIQRILDADAAFAVR